jgi:NAD+ synthase
MRDYKQIVTWLDDYLTTNKLDCFVVGVSGGIDSAVTSTLCALTSKPVYVLNMPIKQKQEQVDLSDQHIKWLEENYKNVVGLKINLTQTFVEFEGAVSKQLGDGFSNLLGLANSRSRLRMVTLYQVAQSKNGLVAGTGNKVEDFGVGFYTKYGDGGVDISPIADLYKSEVYEIARELGVVDGILNAKPTDGLWDDDRKDEDQIGATYDELEWAMQYNGSDVLTDREKEVLDVYNKHHKRNKHKMVEIPVFKFK